MRSGPHIAAKRLCRLSLIAFALGVPAAVASAADAATLVVDDDRSQCAQAAYAAIQPAVDAAQPGDTVRICAGNYAEEVTVSEPLTLRGEPNAIEALDCYRPTASTLGDLDPTGQAIVDPPGDGFSTALKLAADDIVIEGLVVEGASVGIDAGDLNSGYRIDHNLIRLNALFAIDLGSEGTRESRVDHNCLRENRFGLVSELDDDSLWKLSDGPERDAWNARDLSNARVDHNATFRNAAGCCGVGLAAAGPGRRDRVTFDHNTLREESVGIELQNATSSAIVGNESFAARFFAILLGGANDRLEIGSNTVRGGTTGVRFEPEQFTFDLLAVPSRNVLVSHNDVRGAVAGIYARPASLTESEISDNTTSENAGNGINMFSSGNVIRDNQSNDNVVAGITAFPGAIGNRFEHNSMHGNGRSAGASFPGADARDLNPLVNGMLQNVWIGNDCDTDIPAGMICGVG